MTEHNNQYTLQPCPWCGLPADVQNHFGHTFWVQCTDLKTCGATNGKEYRFPAEAIAAWNRRTLLTEQSQERDWGASPALEAMQKQSNEFTEKMRKQLNEMHIAKDMHKNPQNLYTSENCVKENAISIHEPAQWQARAGTGDWLNIAAHSVKTYEQINGFEVRTLYAAPLDAQAIRRKALEEACNMVMGFSILGVDGVIERIQALINKIGEAG